MKLKTLSTNRQERKKIRKNRTFLFFPNSAKFDNPVESNWERNRRRPARAIWAERLTGRTGTTPAMMGEGKAFPLGSVTVPKTSGGYGTVKSSVTESPALRFSFAKADAPGVGLGGKLTRSRPRCKSPGPRSCCRTHCGVRGIAVVPPGQPETGVSPVGHATATATKGDGKTLPLGSVNVPETVACPPPAGEGAYWRTYWTDWTVWMLLTWSGPTEKVTFPSVGSFRVTAQSVPPVHGVGADGGVWTRPGCAHPGLRTGSRWWSHSLPG